MVKCTHYDGCNNEAIDLCMYDKSSGRLGERCEKHKVEGYNYVSYSIKGFDKVEVERLIKNHEEAVDRRKKIEDYVPEEKEEQMPEPVTTSILDKEVEELTLREAELIRIKAREIDSFFRGSD